MGYIYFEDEQCCVEEVLRYSDENVMRQELERFHDQCRERGVDYLKAHEISEGKAKRLIANAPDQTMYYTNNAEMWYVSRFHY